MVHKPLLRPTLPASIWVLGFVSLLMDISSEMIHALLPLFMVTGLGASVLTVGIIEGLAESTALIVKVFSGTLSDYLGRRKGLAVIGYALGAVSKPLFAVATTTGLVLSARLLDRVGKGIRGAPRDALIADLAPPGLRGAAYGLRQSLDKVGALLGPLLAVGLMLLWHNDFRAIFWVALVPAFMSVGLLIFGIREPSRPKDAEQVNPIKRVNLKRLNRDYWWVVGIGGVFALARFSEAFLVLRAAQTGIPLAWVPMVMVCMSLLYAMTAYPFGKLSDVMNRKTMLIIGLIVLIAADVVLAMDGHWWTVLVGVALWGIHMGITQGLLSTLVADTAPVDLRGTAFGVFNLISGVAMLLASVTAGLIWDQFGASYTFAAGAVFASLAITGVLAWRQPTPHHQECHKMKLYTGDLSPYSAKIRMQIYAMGIQDDVEFGMPVEFMMGKMAKVSPIGRIPVLQTDEGLIPESEVIAEYLDDLYPTKAMVGTTPKNRADVRVLSRIGDIYLMNNIFMSLSQMNPETRSQAVIDLLMGQVERGIGALEQHLGDGAFAVGDTLTRADCSLVPALWMCAGTVPRFGGDNPIKSGSRVAAYWDKIQKNEFATKIIDEMNRGLKARLDGTEQKLREEMIAKAKQT